MARQITVGRSEGRTPGKHGLMDALAGKEVGMVSRVLSRRHNVINALMIDLTAGDAAPPDCTDVKDWRRNCSPGILAYHAANATAPTHVDLYEASGGTFEVLVRNLTEYLPQLGYEPIAGAVWSWRHQKAQATITAHRTSGENASLSRVNSNTAVFVTHDPNHIRDWAMRPSFAMEVRAKTLWFTSITTMGCNVGGLKRTDYAERVNWFTYVESIASNLYPHHELFLCAINGDAAQWAYLVEVSHKDDHADDLEKKAHQVFNAQGLSLRHAWFKRGNGEFIRILRELFLTKDERAA